MWNFQDFSPTHILREINFGHFEAQKTAILTILEALNFEIWRVYDIFQYEVSKNQNSMPPKLLKWQI